MPEEIRDRCSGHSGAFGQRFCGLPSGATSHRSGNARPCPTGARLHHPLSSFPEDAAAANTDGAVQFYCDVTEEGIVETVHALVADKNIFRAAVQSALDWGRFTPATVNGVATRVYLAGTVLFIHQNGEPVIVVSLATQDRDRVGKLANYVQPQLVGGLRLTLQKEIASLTQAVLVSGQAEVVVHINAKGAVTGTSGISENPKSSGLGKLLDDAVKKAQFTPAYEDGKATAGAINVVANFSKF